MQRAAGDERTLDEADHHLVHYAALLVTRLPPRIWKINMHGGKRIFRNKLAEQTTGVAMNQSSIWQIVLGQTRCRIAGILCCKFDTHKIMRWLLAGCGRQKQT